MSPPPHARFFVDFLQPPSSFHIPPTLLPSVDPPSSAPVVHPSSGQGQQGAGKRGQATTAAQSLIERYGLGSKVKVPVSRKGKEREAGEMESALVGREGQVGLSEGRAGEGRVRWEDTKEKREQELRDRKERMILEARR